MPVVGKRFREALVWAAELHEDQSRKGGNIPYVGHLLGVSAIVLEHGGTEDQAIAALLHDALEDQAEKIAPGEIARRFGATVERIVEACTDGDPEAQRDRNQERWYRRKEQYIADMAAKPREAILVSMADKLYNARSILEDYRALGEPLWSRFTTGRKGTLWYYESLVAAFRPASTELGHARLWGELDRTLGELKGLIAGTAGTSDLTNPKNPKNQGGA